MNYHKSYHKQLKVEDYSILAESTSLSAREICNRWSLLYNRMCDVVESGESNFNMGIWLKWKDEQAAYFEDPSEVVLCKTAACLGGHATAVIPGLTIVRGDLAYGNTRYSAAFGEAMGIGNTLAVNMCSSMAPHQTAKQAKAMVLLFAEVIHERLGYEMYDKEA